MNPTTLPDVSFNMVRADMAAIPQHPLPPGYRLRAYQEGDGITWLNVQRAAEPFIAITDDYFTVQYGEHLDALPDRMYFVESADGETAGTISAWWERDRYHPNERGRIHWVAVHPAHQRRGLAKPMMTHAMHRLAQEYGSALLGTSCGRPWAIKVYLDFGFRPHPSELSNPVIFDAWVRVQTVIRYPALESILAQTRANVQA